jgi:hypothetical protein
MNALQHNAVLPDAFMANDRRFTSFFSSISSLLGNCDTPMIATLGHAARSLSGASKRPHFGVLGESVLEEFRRRQ